MSYKKTITSTVAFAAVAGLGFAAWAGPDEDKLVINGEIEIVTETAAPAHMDYVDTIYSGWRFRSDETQAVQADDFDNPAMIFVEGAMEVWETAEGSAPIGWVSVG